MSEGEFNNNRRGVLFVNDKQGNPKRPDYRGHCEIDGVKWAVSAWQERSRGGKDYLSLRLEPYVERGREQKPAPSSSTKTDNEPFNDDIPF